MRAVADGAAADLLRCGRPLDQGLVSRREYDTRRADAIAAREPYQEI